MNVIANRIKAKMGFFARDLSRISTAASNTIIGGETASIERMSTSNHWQGSVIGSASNISVQIKTKKTKHQKGMKWIEGGFESEGLFSSSLRNQSANSRARAQM
jgi:hypothetical protein